MNSPPPMRGEKIGEIFELSLQETRFKQEHDNELWWITSTTYLMIKGTVQRREIVNSPTIFSLIVAGIAGFWPI